jgi:hypothetical protein
MFLAAIFLRVKMLLCILSAYTKVKLKGEAFPAPHYEPLCDDVGGIEVRLHSLNFSFPLQPLYSRLTSNQYLGDRRVGGP